MNTAFGLVLALIEFVCAVAQFQVAVGRADYDFWPFVKSNNRTVQLVIAAAFLVMAVGILVVTFI